MAAGYIYRERDLKYNNIELIVAFLGYNIVMSNINFLYKDTTEERSLIYFLKPGTP